MNKNLVPKAVFIVILMALAAYIVFPPSQTLKPGIDLAGGTSLTYAIDTEGLTADAQRGLAQKMITVLRRRIDPANIQNLVSVNEYMSFVLQLVLLSGLIFELPMVAYFLARLGILTPAFMKRYRRHAIVVIMIIAAAVTPTTDPVTMTVFAVPMLALYEISIWVAKMAVRKRAEARARDTA